MTLDTVLLVCLVAVILSAIPVLVVLVMIYMSKPVNKPTCDGCGKELIGKPWGDEGKHCYLCATEEGGPND